MRVTKSQGLEMASEDICTDCAKRLVCMHLATISLYLSQNHGLDIRIRNCPEFFNEDQCAVKVEKYGYPLPSPYKYVVV